MNADTTHANSGVFRSQPILRVEQKHERPFEVELEKDVCTIGRSSSNDLTFNHLSLSRHHARIIKRDDKYFLEDTGSRNGSFLNGIRIHQATPLKPGDVIQLGEITLRFVLPFAEKVQVTDTSPVVGMEATFMIDSDQINFLSYAEEIRSGAFQADQVAVENMWPALNKAAAALITHYPVDQLVELIMDIVFQAVPADRGALIMLDPNAPDQLELKVVRNTQANQNLQISRTIIQEVMQNKKAVLTLDARADFGGSESIQMQGIRSIICVPLWNNKDVIGIIYIDTLLSKRSFSQSDLRLVALIANMAAVKIENALLLEEQLEKRRMEEQLAVASQIQRRLLPQVNPELAHYQIYGVNRTCYQIGGDYYDFIAKKDDRLAIVIADVAGKGIGAALLMAAFQASIRTLIQTEKDPATLMARLNQVMKENAPPNKYITVFYAELDTTSNLLEYVNAGHNPPIFLSKDKPPVLLEACGPVIGILPQAKFESKQLPIETDDMVILYTDGVTECRNPEDEEFGEDGVIQFLRKNFNASMEDLASMLENHIREFSHNAPPLDDSTLVLLKRIS
jgi:serine phosphatase RsbU (regulator of sigma subunit)/pSer/pThr/pTyr-binding forkhead associated (FHA) protein